MEEREGGKERIGEAKSSRMDKEYSLGRLGRGRRKSRPIVREVMEGGREVVGWWKKLPKAREVREGGSSRTGWLKRLPKEREVRE